MWFTFAGRALKSSVRTMAQRWQVQQLLTPNSFWWVGFCMRIVMGISLFVNYYANLMCVVLRLVTSFVIFQSQFYRFLFTPMTSSIKLQFNSPEYKKKTLAVQREYEIFFIIIFRGTTQKSSKLAKIFQWTDILLFTCFFHFFFLSKIFLFLLNSDGTQ